MRGQGSINPLFGSRTQSNTTPKLEDLKLIPNPSVGSRVWLLLDEETIKLWVENVYDSIKYQQDGKSESDERFLEEMKKLQELRASGETLIPVMITSCAPSPFQPKPGEPGKGVLFSKLDTKDIREYDIEFISAGHISETVYVSSVEELLYR